MTWRSHEKWGSSPAKCKYILTFLAIRFRFFFFTTQLHIFCNYDFSVFSNNACDNCGDNVCTIADTERMDPDLYDEFGNYVWAGECGWHGQWGGVEGGEGGSGAGRDWAWGEGARPEYGQQKVMPLYIMTHTLTECTFIYIDVDFGFWFCGIRQIIY